MSKVRIQCPTCDAPLEFLRRPSVDRVRCPKCSKPMRLPATSPDAEEDDEQEEETVRPVAQRRPKRRSRRRQSQFVKAPFIVAGVFLAALAVGLAAVVFWPKPEKAVASGSSTGLDPKEQARQRFAGCRPEDFVPRDPDAAAKLVVRPKQFFSTPFFSRLSPKAQAALRMPLPAENNSGRSAEEFDFFAMTAPLTPGARPFYTVQHHTGGKSLLPEFKAGRQQLNPEPGIEIHVDPPPSPRAKDLNRAYAQPIEALLITCTSEQYLQKQLQSVRPSRGAASAPLARLEVNGFRKLKSTYAGGDVMMPGYLLFLMNTFGDDLTGEIVVDAGEKLSLRLDSTAPSAAEAAGLAKRIVELQKSLSAGIQVFPPEIGASVREVVAPFLRQKANVDGARVRFEFELDAEAASKLVESLAKLGPP